MADLDPIDFPASGLALEPVEALPAAQEAPVKKTCFQIDTRDKCKGDRRQNGERRQTIRFEADRRSGQERRPHKPGWEQGTI